MKNSMPPIEKMQTKHFQSAANLANTMDWHMTDEDFAFNSQLEPNGCFVAVENNKVVGAATCISYGQVGWFGNLIVDNPYRKQGLGTQLVKQAANYLKTQCVKTIGLYAYQNLIEFYGKLCFKKYAEFIVLKADSVGEVPQSDTLVKKPDQKTIEALFQLDENCFGSKREKLLQTILENRNNRCYCSYHGSEIVGFIAAKVYQEAAEVGPLICKSGNQQIAASLLNGILQDLKGYEAYLYLPEKETALLQLAQKAGFKDQFHLTQMFLGPILAKNCIYLAESLERG
jgi:ribosomal protein S18 acetylase RimI-like enzyme